MAIRLNDDAGTQIIEHQGLMGFSETKFPRNPCMFNPSLGRSTGSAIVTTDKDYISVRFCDAGGEGEYGTDQRKQPGDEDHR